MPPRPPPLPRPPRQPRPRSGTPAWSRRAPRCLRRPREAPSCRVRWPRRRCLRAGARRIRRSAPAAWNAAAWRTRADGVHPPMQSAILAHRDRVAPGRRHPQAMAAAPRRTPAGCPGDPGLIGMAPDPPPSGGPWTLRSLRLAPRRHQKKVVSTPAAAGRKAALAPRHYRSPAARGDAADPPLRRPATASGSDVPRARRCPIVSVGHRQALPQSPSGPIPRIDQFDLHALKVAEVPRCHRQAVRMGDRRDLAVDGVQMPRRGFP